jgi:uncharacterized protein YndB with AHSA1/START domain
VTSTRIRHRVNAPRATVYRALLDARAVAMTITIALADADGGTEILAVHDGLPPGVPAADNEAGWRSSLSKLAALVEAGRDT